MRREERGEKSEERGVRSAGVRAHRLWNRTGSRTGSSVGPCATLALVAAGDTSESSTKMTPASSTGREGMEGEWVEWVGVSVGMGAGGGIGWDGVGWDGAGWYWCGKDG